MGVRPAGKGTSFHVPLRIWELYYYWIDGCHRKASRDSIASRKELGSEDCSPKSIEVIDWIIFGFRFLSGYRRSRGVTTLSGLSSFVSVFFFKTYSKCESELRWIRAVLEFWFVNQWEARGRLNARPVTVELAALWPEIRQLGTQWRVVETRELNRWKISVSLASFVSPKWNPNFCFSFRFHQKHNSNKHLFPGFCHFKKIIGRVRILFKKGDDFNELKWAWGNGYHRMEL